jgi:ABC-2 type transport system permease protein
MDSTLDLSRWREAPRSVAYRRWTIVTAGMRGLLRTRFFRALVGVAWLAGTLIAVAGFTFSQSLASGGWLETLAEKSSPRAEALFQVLAGLVALYPDVVVNTVFTVIFWAHSFLGLWLSLIALTVLAPQLITRDRASNALVVYLSRPLTSADYLLGKLGIIVGVIALMWTGPLLFGWLLSMLFATDRDFIVYSFSPLLRALAFNGIGVVALAAIALGVSASARQSRTAVIIWLGLWLVLGFMAAPPRAPEWIQRASFTRNLSEVRGEVLRLDTALIDAATELPIADQRFVANLNGAGKRAESTDVAGAFASLGVFVAAASFVFFRKLRPE